MAVTLSPSLAAGLGSSPPDKADLRAWLEAIVSAINSDLDPRATPIYASRAAAVSAASDLPSGLTHIAVREGTALVIRSRSASADDPLFEAGPRWGVVQRQDVEAERTARINAIRDTGVLPLANVAGTANAITADIAPAVPGVTLSALSTVELIPAADNTGAATLNVGGAGGWPVQRRDGSAVQAGDLKANVSITLRRRGNAWRAVHALDSDMDGKVAAEATARINATRATGILSLADVGGGANAITAVVAPSVGVLISDQSTVLLVPAADSTGPVTLNVGGAGAWPVQRADGTALQPGDLKAGVGRHLRRAGTAWRMVGVAPSEVAELIDAETAPLREGVAANAARTTDAPSILIVADDAGQIAAQIGADGALHLAGMEEPVQQAIAGAVERAPRFDDMQAIFDLRDADGVPVVRIAGDGAAYFAGMSRSVQKAGLVVDRLEQPWLERDHSVRDLDLAKMTALSPAAGSILMGAIATRGGRIAPVPAWSLQQAWTPPLAWFQQVSWTATASDGYHLIDSPYRANDQFVHPKILHFPFGWNGYRWIMGITPYASEPEENPCLYGSNDLKNFDLLSNWAEMPLAKPTGRYLSDISLTYDPTTGEIVCLWRGPSPISGNDVWAIFERRTLDGYHWTAAEQIFDAAMHDIERAVCPSLIYNASEQRWWMFMGDKAALQAFVSKTCKLGTWTEIPLTGAPNEWHVDVQLVGNRLLGVGGHVDASKGGLKISYSEEGDWTRWTRRGADAMDVSALTAKYGVAPVPYKSSAVPIVHADGTIRTALVWSTFSRLDDKQWRVFTTMSAPFQS